MKKKLLLFVFCLLTVIISSGQPAYYESFPEDKIGMNLPNRLYFDLYCTQGFNITPNEKGCSIFDDNLTRVKKNYYQGEQYDLYYTTSPQSVMGTWILVDYGNEKWYSLHTPIMNPYTGFPVGPFDPPAPPTKFFVCRCCDGSGTESSISGICRCCHGSGQIAR